MKKIICCTKRGFKLIFQSFKAKRIQFIIIVAFIFTTLLDMAAAGILYKKYSNTAEQNIEISTRQIVDQLSLNMDYYQNTIRKISDLICGGISYDKMLPDDKILKQLDVIGDTRDDIVSISVFSDKGDLVMGTPFSKLKENVNVSEQEWFKKALKNPDDMMFSEPHVQNLFLGKHNWVISHSRSVNYVYNGKNIRGVLLIDLNFNTIDQLCQKANLGIRGYIYIIDTEGNLIYHPQQELIYAGLKDENWSNMSKYSYGGYIQKYGDESRLITVRPVSYMGWQVVGVSYMDELISTKKELVRFSILVIFIEVIFVSMMFIFISAQIIKPIKRLEGSMKKVEEGSFDINADIKGAEEVVHLSKTFNIMICRIKELMEQIVFEHEALRKSELNALQAQINPHFLYNTLDSIVWMAESGKKEEVISMVTALARLFRISISRGKNIINVQQEIEHARNYLIIQKVRYKNKFEYEINVSEEVAEYKTLKLILQPIIENAIYHGIEYMVDEGFIRISANIVDGKLLYKVEDNGLGMDHETAERILSINPEKKGSTGVGVKNVHERIRLSFGDEYGIRIESELEEGTKVEIWLPLLKDEEEIQK